MLYSAPQLRVLLVLATLFLVGFGVKQWRQGFPDTAGWLEREDREPPAAPLLSTSSESSMTPSKTSSTLAEASPTRRESHAISAGGSSRALAPRPPDPDVRPLDINRATVSELARLPGVGPGLAQRIFDERERHGRFDSPDALRRVVGIGPKKLAALRDLITVGE